MLIKSEKRGIRISSLAFAGAAFIALVILVFTSGTSTMDSTSERSNDIICDLESVEGDMFSQDGHLFFGASTRSSARARSGSYSSRLGGEDIYGLRYDLSDPDPGAMYEVSVWMSRTGGDRGKLAVSAEDKTLYKEVELPLVRKDDGWELLQLHFRVPDEISSPIRIYTYAPENAGYIYFDDLRIHPVTPDTIGRVPDETPSELNLTIDNKDYKKLERKKWDAVSKGILMTEDEDWVKAKIESAKGDIPVNVRLKGDWLDHLQARKWSFRIKVKDPYSWNRLITFSIQSPETRMFMREWFYHQFLAMEGINTPRYDFLKVRLNGEDLGVYAWEEHFDKQLVESKQRREGPILKLTEDGFWMSYKMSSDYAVNSDVERLSHDAMWDSDIRPFKESRTLANPALKAQFERAQNLLYGFKYRELAVDEVFDIDQMARYLAITDVAHAYHGITWHNIRFYYNPVTARIEPIGYDGFGTQMTYLDNGPFFGYYAETDDRGELLSRLFADPGLVRSYHSYLEKYTDRDWLDELLTLMGPSIQERNNLISSEYPEGVLDQNAILLRAQEIRHYLRARDAESLRARTAGINEDIRTVALTNQHPLPLDIIGYTDNAKKVVVRVDKPIHLPRGGKHAIPETREANVPVQAVNIAFTVAGLDSVYFSPIMDFKPIEVRQYQSAGEKFDPSLFDFVSVLGNEVVINKGTHILEKNLDLPKGMALRIEPGVIIDVINNARIVVRGPIMSIGSEENPILFRSSDNSASGFTVLNAGSTSEFIHTEFQGFNTLREEGWTLTGAVTFYESDVRMRNCRFVGNMCEDALNTVRSNIDIDGLYIGDTQFDGFDSDFCTGRIGRAFFSNTGNDAIDFSGSQIQIDYCKIENAGDKGISVGEESELTIAEADVTGCNIGVASKDLSVCNIERISISNCKQGFTAYQKKPEFGPATLNITTYEMSEVGQPYLIEQGSVLNLGDRKIEGDD